MGDEACEKPDVSIAVGDDDVQSPEGYLIGIIINLLERKIEDAEHPFKARGGDSPDHEVAVRPCRDGGEKWNQHCACEKQNLLFHTVNGWGNCLDITWFRIAGAFSRARIDCEKEPKNLEEMDHFQ